MDSPNSRDWWWNADKETAHRNVFEYVSTVESDQFDMYDRMLRYASLYDPHTMLGMRGAAEVRDTDRVVSENVCASSVDTVTSRIFINRPRIVIQTDGADWSTQRQAKEVERYIAGQFQMTEFHRKASLAGKDGAVFGLGSLKIFPDYDERRIVVERVSPMETIVDEAECTSDAPPRQRHQRKIVDRGILRRMFRDVPGAAEAISKAQISGPYGGTHWCDYLPRTTDQCVVIESWRLGNEPYDGDDEDNLRDARDEGERNCGIHTISIDGFTLLWEEWKLSRMPFVDFRWIERLAGFMGMGMVEQLAGRQRRINRLNDQLDMQLDQLAYPRMWVKLSDAKMVNKATKSGAGYIIPYVDTPGEWKVPPAVSPEMVARLDRLVDGAPGAVGTNTFATNGKLPAGIESAVGQREYNDITDSRFGSQTTRFEDLALDGARLMIEWSRHMAKQGKAPEVPFHNKRRTRAIKWKEVDLHDVPYTMDVQAAGLLGNSPSGRLSKVMELVERQMIPPNVGLRLLDHPDLEAEMSLLNAALESVDMVHELLLEGDWENPEPYDHFEVEIPRMIQHYKSDRTNGAPEDILENVRTWILQSLHLQGLVPPPPAPAVDPMTGMPMDPAMAGAGAAPMMPDPMAPPGMQALPPVPPGGVPTM